jgi:hypothetical protein
MSDNSRSSERPQALDRFFVGSRVLGEPGSARHTRRACAAASSYPATLRLEMRLKITTAVIALVLVAGAGVAAAAVVIYSNDFSSRKEFRSVQKFEGGKPCRKFWRDKKTFGVEVRSGPLQCDFRTPLSGDAKEPDHEIEAAATVLDSTSKGARRDAYVGVALRADKSSRYELRVFPDTRTFELRRRPDGGEFPIRGTSAAISRIGKDNRLKLRAFGDTITALVNKTRVVPEVVDPNPDELNGRNTLIVAGHGGSSGKSVEGSFRDVRIRLP